MSSRRFRFLIPVVFGIFVTTTVFLLRPAEDANAQCGSQASSCKNCHEVQAAAPVNNDGTDWHQSHAFGDFCEFCHAGNVQAPEMDAAHMGMVPPLSDVKASCSTCHADDLMEMAEVYAVTLGVEVGAAGGAAASAGADSAADGAAEATSAQPVAATAVTFTPEMDINDPNVIDYVQRYEEIVLGIHPTNWGNVILTVLIGAVVVGGGAFVVKNEDWLVIDEEVVEGETAVFTPNTTTNALISQINKLPPDAQKTLAEILEQPQEAAQLLQSLSKIKK